MPTSPNRITDGASSRQIVSTARPCRAAEINSSTEPAHNSRMVTSQSTLTPRCWKRNCANVPPTPNRVAAVTALRNPIRLTRPTMADSFIAAQFLGHAARPADCALSRLAEAQGHAVAFADGVIFAVVEFGIIAGRRALTAGRQRPHPERMVLGVLGIGV